MELKKDSRQHMKRLKQVLWVLTLSLVIAGCGIRNMDSEEETELSYTVVKTDEIPAEVLEIIEKQKAQEFQMTYQSEDYLYIMKGYGLQNSGGYSIKVLSLVQRGGGDCL